MRVIVIGSGIAGLSAAIGLCRAGIDVTVYERAAMLTEIGAGISLWTNALRALDALGARAAIETRTQNALTTEFRYAEGHGITTSFDAAWLEAKTGLAPLVAMIHRADLVGALASCLPPDVARYGFECAGVEDRGGHAIAQFANGHVDEADAVIGADGIHSVVRTSLFGSEEPRYSGYTCWRGICARPAALTNGYIAEWWGYGKRMGITTLPGDRVYWWATQNAPANGRAPDERAHLADRFRDWADPVSELFATTAAENIIRNDIIDRPPTKTWSRGRIGLIGDAAHPTTPNFGQGGCMAIEDAVILAQAFRKHSDPSDAFGAFAAERYSRTARITKESWNFGRVGQWENRVACWIRDHAMRLTMPHLAPKMFPKNAAFETGPI